MRGTTLHSCAYVASATASEGDLKSLRNFAIMKRPACSSGLPPAPAVGG